MVADPSNLNGAQLLPFHWLMSPVALAIQMSFVSGLAGADAEMVMRFPPSVLTVMPSDSMLGVTKPFCMMPPRPPAPGAVEVVAPDPGSCAVCTVPGENPVLVGALRDGVEAERPLFRGAADRLGVPDGPAA